MPELVEPDRHVALETIFNFRDLGGYRTADRRTVQWRTLYRADALHRLTGPDLEAVAALGITTVLDLRTVGEVEERGRFPYEHVPVDYRHLPLIPAIWDPATLAVDGAAEEYLADRYLEMLDVGRPAIVEALEVLATPDRFPAVFHCAAGKDRTGMLAAIVLGALGVEDDAIVDDYGLSRAGMSRMAEWLRVTAPEDFEQMQNQPPAFLGAPPEAMRRVLAAVRTEHGSIEGYLAGIGVGAEVLSRVRENLLD